MSNARATVATRGRRSTRIAISVLQLASVRIHQPWGIHACDVLGMLPSWPYTHEQAQETCTFRQGEPVRSRYLCSKRAYPTNPTPSCTPNPNTGTVQADSALGRPCVDTPKLCACVVRRILPVNQCLSDLEVSGILSGGDSQTLVYPRAFCAVHRRKKDWAKGRCQTWWPGCERWAKRP